jgi:uncharacterized protein (DUF488 family)
VTVVVGDSADSPGMQEDLPVPAAPKTLPDLITVGHGTHAAEQFLHLLRSARVESLVDVRIGPGSRRNPQFGRDELGSWLPGGGVDYRWDKRLGGFRRLPPGSPDVALRNESFRAYAAHMRTAEFTGAVDELLAGAAERRTAIMCSESVWWRCHRRMIADHVQLLHGVPVRHLMPDGRLSDHPPTSGVRVAGDALVYDLVEPAP